MGIRGLFYLLYAVTAASAAAAAEAVSEPNPYAVRSVFSNAGGSGLKNFQSHGTKPTGSEFTQFAMAMESRKHGTNVINFWTPNAPAAFGEGAQEASRCLVNHMLNKDRESLASLVSHLAYGNHDQLRKLLVSLKITKDSHRTIPLGGNPKIVLIVPVTALPSDPKNPAAVDPARMRKSNTKGLLLVESGTPPDADLMGGAARACQSSTYTKLKEVMSRNPELLLAHEEDERGETRELAASAETNVAVSAVKPIDKVETTLGSVDTEYNLSNANSANGASAGEAPAAAPPAEARPAQPGSRPASDAASDPAPAAATASESTATSGLSRSTSAAPTNPSAPAAVAASSAAPKKTEIPKPVPPIAAGYKTKLPPLTSTQKTEIASAPIQLMALASVNVNAMQAMAKLQARAASANTWQGNTLQFASSLSDNDRTEGQKLAADLNTVGERLDRWNSLKSVAQVKALSGTHSEPEINEAERQALEAEKAYQLGLIDVFYPQAARSLSSALAKQHASFKAQVPPEATIRERIADIRKLLDALPAARP